jgi:sugar phosphate isomerase/epimerase
LWDPAKHAEEVADLAAIAGWSAQMGATHLIMSGSRLPHVDGKLNEEAARIKAEGLNKVGAVCSKEGLRFSYHTHTAEFEDSPTSEIDILLRNTDPRTVWFNYDVGNAYPKGPDPAQFSAEHFRRISVYHLKDAGSVGPDGKAIFTDLGKGKINLKGVVAPVLNSDWRGWLVVEREGKWPNPVDDPEGKLRACREYIRQITGL